MKTQALAQKIFSIPTSPFHEKYVLQTIEAILKQNKIPYFYDKGGNLIAGAKSQKTLPKKSVAFVAHTDHPGFHFTLHKKAKKVTALWMGGGPLTQMKGAKVLAHNFSDPQKKYLGKITQFEPGNHREGLEFKITFTKDVPPGDYFGAFNFAGFKLKNNLIVTKAADDLAGCVMALGALIDLKKTNKKAIAVFTRAEEVGFVGCLHLLNKKVLPPATLVISLEASRTLPGALLGEGPVVRQGDASTLFDSKFSLFISKIAQELNAKDAQFKFQKRVMDGGSCEATAFSQFDYTTMGLAVPLDNYHNMGKKGPAPEIIHQNDMENGRRLLCEVAKNLDRVLKVSSELKSRLNSNFKLLEKHLYLREHT